MVAAAAVAVTVEVAAAAAATVMGKENETTRVQQLRQESGKRWQVPGDALKRTI